MHVKKLILVVACLLILSACKSPATQTNGDLLTSNLPKDPNLSSVTCVKLGEDYHVAPADERLDKCCENLIPAAYSTSQDGSTGYSHYTCIHSGLCTAEGEAVQTDNYVACCSGLIIMDGKCVSKDNCSAGDDQILISTALNQKECIDFPECTTSGDIKTSACQYCCPGSKYTTQMITGMPPQKCLGPNENLTPEEVDQHWTEKLITQEAYDSFKESCMKRQQS